MRKSHKTYIRYLPVYGCFSTGIIYVAVGTIAILSFLKIKHGGADESSLMEFLNQYLLGKVLVWIILLGTIAYIVWRIYESISDPYKYGNKPKGRAMRMGLALSTIPDALISYSAITILFGLDHIREDGEPRAERDLVNELLQDPGAWFIIAIGSIILITGVVQLIYGVTKGYKERIDIAHFTTWKKRVIHWLADIGYVARGVIVGIIGFFLIKAGITKKSEHVVNTDKAFDFIGDHVGHVYFILLAIGTICYGLFMFSLAIAYDVDKD